MLKIEQIRHRGIEHFNFGTCHRSPERAFVALVEGELAFGGIPVTLTPTRITVKTEVMRCVDLTTFEGTEEEMKPLVLVTSLYLQLLRANNGSIYTDAAVNSIMAVTKGNPLLVKLGAGMIAGDHNIRIVLAAMFDSEDLALVAMKRPTKEIMVALTLHLFYGVAAVDAVSLFQ